ncbi:MAG: hypothetical protein Q8O78_07720, partial [Candidatus Deferrimicrobium sp.]|nr:hypothetical protein [Candidatus Deferrimicrobium sp.]
RGGQRLAYGDLTGREKRDYLFDAGIRATAYANEPGGSRPDVRQGLLQFTASALNSIAHHLLVETVTRSSDELETPKPKLFHSYGTTAKIVFTPGPGTPYTGIFGEQAWGLARFSYAGPVVGIGVVPGLGLKFPVDGDRPSENVVVMRMLDPQSQHSVFENAFTNILPVPRFTNLVMRAVKARFETVVVEGRGLHQPVENLARVHPSGLPVDGALRAPYRVIFVPTEAARRASNPALDFRDDLAQSIPSGTTIYEVLALDEAREAALLKTGAADLDELIPHAERIGTVTTESEFIASKYGDYRLFFKHSDVFLRKELR